MRVSLQQEESWKIYPYGLSFVSILFWVEPFSWYSLGLWVGCRDNEERGYSRSASMPILKGGE